MNLWRWLTGKQARPAARPPEVAASGYGGPQALTLQDLVLLKVSLSWQEAVAVVCECLNSLADRRTFPDPARVALTEIGEVRPIGAVGLPGHPVQAAATLLRDLLGTTLAPPELRATVQQNLGPEPRHATLDELAAALAYFERPGRRGDVAAVYGRGHALYVKAQADLELERLRARAVRDQAITAAAPVEAVVTWQQRALNAALVVVLIFVIGVGGVALFTMAFAPLAPREREGAGSEPTSPIASATAAGGEARRLLEASLAKASGAVESMVAKAAESAPTADTPAAPGGAATPRRTAPRPAPTPSTAEGTPTSTTGITAGDRPAPSSGDGRVPQVEWTVSVRDVTAAMAGQPVIDTTAGNDANDTLPLFTGADGDVAPAVLVRPQLPSRMSGGEARASTLDLVIDEFGRVERVRLESARSNLNEKMLVSAAKAWVFQPAVRDGRAVRYRLRVQLSE